MLEEHPRPVGPQELRVFSGSIQDERRDLRRISNVIQALENVIIQCGGAQQFRSLEAIAVAELAWARRMLHKELHR